MLNYDAKLYHGSYARVEAVNLAKCQAGKDFGAGFYLTDDELQAKNSIKTSLLKAQRFNDVEASQDFGYVSEFKFCPASDDLKIYEFRTADSEWLDFVSFNRRNPSKKDTKSDLSSTLLEADIIIGKIANDNTNKIINAYLNGLYGDVESPQAKEIALGLLLPNRLKNQYCFLSKKAIDSLIFEKAVRYDV